MKMIYALFVLFFLFSAEACAERIKLKSGEIIEGDVLNEDTGSVTIKVKYGTIKIDRTQIGEEAKKEEFMLPEAAKIPLTLSALPFKWIKDLNIKKDIRYMYKWLKNQKNSNTNILESYRPTSDVFLQNQGSTYDQALAGLAFLMLNDYKGAQEILDFYKKRWDGKGFCNFYFTPTGNSGIESTAHLGPNMWIALLALHYDRIIKKDKYLNLALDIVKWAMTLKHYKGGAAMSDKDEWRAPWTAVVSTENNIDYYVVLTMLIPKVKDMKLRERLEMERSNVLDFLTKVVYDKRSGGMFRGYSKGIVDREAALDTVTWFLLALGIEELKYRGVDPDSMIDYAEERFLVSDQGIKGFDFTDNKGAFKAKRSRMISIEWTFGMVNVYCMMGKYYQKLSQDRTDKNSRIYLCKAKEYENKARFYINEADKKILKFGASENMYAYPYATRSFWLVFYDSPWWKTPKANTDNTIPGSVASTSWRIFAGRFNPLNSEGDL